MTSAENEVLKKAEEIPRSYGCDDRVNLVFEDFLYYQTR
jgi:hypothetical protein